MCIRDRFDALEARLGRETCQIGLVNSHFEERFVWDMATDPGLLDQMQELMGEDLMVFGTHFFCKYPVETTEHFVAWHQDVTYWGLEPLKNILLGSQSMTVISKTDACG